jgi:hypothetical protein
MSSYANFLANQQREDHFSMKLRELYDKKQSAVSDLPEALKDEFDALIHLLKSKSEEEKNQQITLFLESLKGSDKFQNIMPYIIDESQLDYSISSDFFKMNDIEKSYLQFEKLAKKLFPNVFTDDKKLKAFFISLISFESINPASTGLYNIDVLEKIFTDNLLNYSSTPAKFDDFLKTYFESDAFSLTYKKLSERLSGKIQGKDRDLLDKNTFLNFNCDLWFKEFDKNRSNFDLNALLHFVGSDSFGSFAFLPDIERPTYSSIGTFDIGKIVNKNKLRCFVFPKVQILDGSFIDIFRTEELYSFKKKMSFIDISSNPTDFKRLIDYNPGFQFFYNASPSRNSMSLPSITRISNGYELRNFTELYNQPLVEMLGGSSKKNKMKGGTKEDLFVTTSAPSVGFTRPLKNYSKDSFFTCVTHLRRIGPLEKTKREITGLIRSLIQEQPKTSTPTPVYPFVYTAGNTQQHFGSFQLTYSDIRLLFLFSSIFTTFIKLFLHFFHFLNNTYSLIILNYEKMQKEPSEKNKSKNTDYFFNQVNKFQNLQKSIIDIINKLQLLINGSKTNTPNLVNFNKFFGFNLTFYKQFLRGNNGSDDPNPAIDSQLNFYESVIDLVCNGLYENNTGGQTKLALKQNIFHETLQKFSILFKIEFGGVPLISDKPEVQNSIIESYKFFVRYVYACQKSFIKYVEYHNDERNVKAKKNVIENIDSNVEREIEEIKKSKSKIVDQCKEILKKVLSKFISKLHEIHQIYSRNKNSSTPETRGNNNSNSKNKELKKKLGEFKIYIAIMESSLTKLLKSQTEINDKQTLELFMMGRFNNLSSLLEYVILNIRSSKIDAILYPMGIQIDFEKGINREDTEKLFKKLVADFFTFKPDLSKNFKILLQNTGFYYRNPSFENIEWWVEKMSDFQERNPGKRLFILGTLRRFGITNKIGIDDPVLIDVGSCALVPDGEEIPIKKFLDIDYTVDKKTGKITEMRYQPAKNTIINLTPFLRYIREGYTRFIKKQSVRREDRGPIMKALIKQIEFRNTNASNNTALSTMGNIIRLFKGKLKNDAGIPISSVILQGASPKQLAEIITSRILNKKTSNVTLSSNKSRVDYQLIKVDKKNLKNSNLFRNFLSRVLFSSPESYHNEEAALDFNLFNLFQVGLSSTYFTTSFGKGSLVIDIFTALQPDNLESMIVKFQKEMANSITQINKITTHKKFALEIAETMKLINQQDLQRLLLERETKYVNVNNNRKKKRTINDETNNRNEIQLGSTQSKRIFDQNSSEQSSPGYIQESTRLNRSSNRGQLNRSKQEYRQAAEFGVHNQRSIRSVQSYRGPYSSQQNNISKIQPVDGNVYSYLLRQNFTDFISYLKKSIEGKIFLNFLNNLPYSTHFQINTPQSARFTYEETQIRYYINYEFRFNETLAILFTNTLGVGKITYACFCNYNRSLKKFTSSPGYDQSFIASFDSFRIKLSLTNIEYFSSDSSNIPQTLQLSNSNQGSPYVFKSSGTEV